MVISAKVIADSVANDIRLTTLELNYPLIIHGQFLTHRVFSRNAESNRAMPNSKVVEQVRNNPAMPSHWGKNQAGMQASDEEVDTITFYSSYDASWMKETPKEFWRSVAEESASMSEYASKSGLHKQVANRLTMPFQYIKVIVTATEWYNFFKLRLNDADPTMMELARCMKEAMDNSTPVELQPGEWHLPYIDQAAWQSNLDDSIKCSVARCARVSYNNHDNSSPNISKDIALADRLLRDGHMSPFEHQATPMEEYEDWDELPSPLWARENGYTHMDIYGNAWSGNFRGFIQNRNLINV